MAKRPFCPKCDKGLWICFCLTNCGKKGCKGTKI
jgi:hypothetical protein